MTQFTFYKRMNLRAGLKADDPLLATTIPEFTRFSPDVYSQYIIVPSPIQLIQVRQTEQSSVHRLGNKTVCFLEIKKGHVKMNYGHFN